LERAGSSQVEGAFGSDKRLRTEEVSPLSDMSDSLAVRSLFCSPPVVSAVRRNPRRLDRVLSACRTIRKGGGFDQ